jgi:hypothetical protein
MKNSHRSPRQPAESLGQPAYFQYISHADLPVLRVLALLQGWTRAFRSFRALRIRRGSIPFRHQPFGLEIIMRITAAP